ncbi:hypothetical protein D3C84_847150 [compost metagenome]
MGDDIGKRQGLVKPAFVESEGIVTGLEVQRAIEVFCIGGFIVGRGMFEARSQQWQRMAEQVVADGFQRHQAELGVEYGQRRIFAVIGGYEPYSLAVVLKTELEKCSQQRRITHRQA